MGASTISCGMDIGGGAAFACDPRCRLHSESRAAYLARPCGAPTAFAPRFFQLLRQGLHPTCSEQHLGKVWWLYGVFGRDGLSEEVLGSAVGGPLLEPFRRPRAADSAFDSSL